MDDLAGETVVLSAERLTKRYGDHTVLHGVSLELRRGELIAIIGPNGAGKTTLLSILAGVNAPDSGTVRRAAAGIGWVPQETSLYTKLSVRENLELFARLEGVGDPAGVVEEMLEQTGLAERREERIGRLSGGNQQRVNIAVGLLSRPAILLLDEPTASLDPPQRARLWSFVAELAGRGTAIFYSTHNVREVERHADRVMVLDGGHVRFTGTPAEMIRLAQQPPSAETTPFMSSLAELG